MKNIGIEENEAEEKDVWVYPNPVSETLTIQTEFVENIIIEIYDLRGQRLYKDIHNGTIQFNVSDWKPGIYLLTFPEKGIVRKFVVR